MHIFLALLYILILVFLIAPVKGLAVAEGAKIIDSDGATSPMIIVESGLAQGGNITIDVTGIHEFVANGIFSNNNVILDNNAVAAGWTSEVAGDILTLTSAGRVIDPGETVTVTFTGAVNPWKAFTL